MFKKISLILVLVVAAFSLVSCTGQLTETGQEEQLPTVAETEVEAETEDYPRKFSGKLSLSIVSDIAIPGQAIDVDVEGSYAYVTDDLGQLYVIDVSSKENPRIVSKVRNIDSANIVIAKGSYAYISYTSWQKDAEEVYSECGFKIISILDEENPQVISNYISGKNTRKSVQVLFVNGNYAYLNTTEVINGEQINQLEIVDIENKDKPRLISKLSIEGMPWSVWASGKYAYVNTSIYQEEEETESRLLVIDIEDKDNPKKVGSCQLPEGTAGIYVEGNFAYVSNNTKGNENGSSSLKSYLQVVDISDKSSPKLMGKCEIPGQGWELDMVGSFVFVSDLEGGVFAVDITEKDNPVITDSLYTSGTSYDITLEGNFGYLADGFSGLTIILLSGEQNGPDTVKLIPQAIFEVFGDNIGEYSYPVGVPVYFSAASSYDPEGEELDFYWEIETQTLEGREISYVFNLPGEYEVSLEVSDGTYSDTATKTVKVRETQSCIVPVDKKNFKIEIEYSIKNNGPGTLKELGCFASTPQTYKPFQIVKEVNPSISNTDVVYDQSWNKITHFDFEGEELEPGEELTATIVCDVDMLQFDFLDMDYRSLKYSEDDDDLVLYTMDDLYIDSGHPEIRKTATEVIGDEERPAVVMEKLYYFVINHLSYDYQRAEDRNYPLLYASEILERGEGVCADYAILYTALLRASGIPSRVASGIPIYTMGLEGGQLSMGHAWVEIKFPEFGWIPVDITIENRFMARDMNMNLVTQRGSGFLHKNTTMDWSSYYYDGFSYSWEEDEAPDVEQQLSYSIRE